MADYLKALKGEQLIAISENFDYVKATANFIGLKLFPMVKTDNLKVAMYTLTNGGEIPTIALVHAFDAEARIGDRPNYEKFDYQLFKIKQKLNQGEELRRKIKDMGMDSTEKAILDSIYDDINNLFSAVLTAFERRACEALCKGKLAVNENGAKFDVDFHLSAKNKLDFTGWNTPTHDILADLIALKKASKNKIVRMIMSSKVMGYILANDKLNKFASNANTYVTQDWAETYIKNLAGIEIIVNDDTYKLSHSDTTEYRFFDEMVVVSLTTTGEVGKTFMAPTSAEDFGVTALTKSFITVEQWIETTDPKGFWTMAEGVGLPVFANINSTLYLSTITA